MIFFFLFQASRYILITNNNLDPADISYISVYTGTLGLIIGSIIYPKLANKFANIKIIYLAYFLLFIGILSISNSNSFISMSIFFTLCIAPQNLVKIPMNIILTKNADENKGYVFGINNSFISFFSALGSMLVGPLLKYFETNSFYIIIIILGVLFLLTYLLEKN